MIIIVWILSLIFFGWCYSTLFMCIKNIKNIPKLSILIYIVIIACLYLITYYWIPSQYFDDIIICSIISAILGFISSKKEQR